MTACWLHIGMPKTGSSSIQETLFYRLHDPRFVYCSFGEINGGYALDALVDRDNHLGSSRGTGLGLSKAGYRQRLGRRLQRCLRQANDRDAEIIISSEFCYLWSAEQHQLFREIASRAGLAIRIVAYVRPPLDWLAAKIGQSLKYGRLNSQAQLRQTYSSRDIIDLLSIGSRLRQVGRIYGPEALVVRPFLAQSLSGGCVVDDFCRTVGIQLDPRAILRQNESLSLAASQCLHIYNLSMQHPLRRPIELLRRDALLERLRHIYADQPGLRLSHTFLGDIEPQVRDQLRMVNQDFGLEIPLSTAASAGAGLNTLEQLLELSPEAKARLCEATGSDRTQPVEAMVRRLEPRLPVRQAWHTGARLMRRELRHRLHGC